ncbi:MAG: putative exported protein [Deltaproteobacteria bacterium]|nr:putative exported protein [Deltaproteobacteria bacterium]
MSRTFAVSLVLISLLALAGCASHGPVLYPNAHLKTVAVGAVTGNFGQTVGAWAAGGGAGGLFYGILRGSEPSPLYRGVVDRCLREKGYDPVGWQ